MHSYRSHTCNELSLNDVGKDVRLSGWIHRVRDHGKLLFIDLRDHYGITQCVFDLSDDRFEEDRKLWKPEVVLMVDGEVLARSEDTINPSLTTGAVELSVARAEILATCEQLPFQVDEDSHLNEDISLEYRFLHLRREKLHKNIVLRNSIVSSIRRRMTEMGFMEFQTPILTASSPEGSRDFLVPSRRYPGQFFALPQAPQQFKQILMISGFDKYFQIAPCFRDEDSRADRTPGEFYQLDIEMSFCTQEDVFHVVETVLQGVFAEFSGDRTVSPAPFPRIPYRESMLKYGSDKPDLRNPLVIADVTDVFRGSNFGLFARQVENGSVVRAVAAPGVHTRARGWFDQKNSWAREQGMGGLGYVIFDNGAAKGPVAKHLDPERLTQLRKLTDLDGDGAVFFICDIRSAAEKFSGQVRVLLGTELGLIDKNRFEFCWVVDFPMYELDEKAGQIVFSHNPFSMPQGGIDALNNMNPLDILAYQYDIVCNGIELSSGAIRNHRIDIMYRAFEIAGYRHDEVESHFGGLVKALKYGAPPHGGSAPGLDRIVMLLAGEEVVRNVIAFPMNQQGRDLMMQAPNTVRPEQLEELNIRVSIPAPEKKG